MVRLADHAFARCAGTALRNLEDHARMTGLFSLLPDAVATVRADSKASVLDQLAIRFAEVYALDRKAVRAHVQSREELGSTGFGRGVAIPHARMTGLVRPVAVFLRLESPVSYTHLTLPTSDLV